MSELLPPERIEGKILLIRGQKVMLDVHLADLYDVETGALNRAVKRNKERFPADFMFRLNSQEVIHLRCQIGISNKRGGRRFYPYAFTEYGVAMLSSVLRSRQAIIVNIEIMRTFGRLRQFLSTHKDLKAKLQELEQHIQSHDQSIQSLFEAIRQMMLPPPSKNRKIGFSVSGN